MRRANCGLIAATLLLGAHPAAASDRVASAGAAYVQHDVSSGTWSIANDRISVAFELASGREPRMIHLRNLATGHDWGVPAPFVGTATVNGRRGILGLATNGFDLVEVTGRPRGANAVTLSATYIQKESHLRVVRTYTVFDRLAAVDMATRFEADAANTAVTLSDLNVWQLTMTGDRLEWVNGLRGDNAANPVSEAFTIQRRAVPLQEGIEFGSSTRSSEQTVPYFRLMAGNDIIVGGLAWSGAWHFSAQPDGSAVSLSMGLGEIVTEIDAEHSVETPHAFMVLASSATSPEQALRDYVIGELRGGRPFPSLVTYNTWYAYGTRLDEASMLNELDRVAALGAELFVVDAGWYPGAGSLDRWDFDTGLGNWHADPERFPSGLRALGDAAHDRGMKFGLWVEPSRVDLSNVGGDGQVAESWLATNGGRYDPAKASPVNAKICLAHKAAQTWVINEMSRLIDESGADYLKWDNNFWINCDRSGHGHGAGDGNLRQVQGLYEVLAALRARYPQLLIENVSGGGNRLDYGLLQYTDVAWVDDRSAPSLHVRHNLQGLTTAFPPGYLLTFLMDAESESLHDGPDVPLYIRSRMAGVLGLTFRTVDLRPSAADEIKNHVAQFKDLRDVIANGTGVTLTGQTAVDAPLPWDVMQVSDDKRVVLLAFQVDPGAGRIAVYPRGLDPLARYEVRSIDMGPLGVATGEQLNADGIEIDAFARSAAHVLILTRQSAASSSIKRR